MTQKPHSIQAEKGVLGGLLVYDETIHIVEELDLTPQDFYLEKHQIIFAAIMTVYQQQQGIDFTLLVSYLESAKLVDRIGGLETLSDIARNAATTSSIQLQARLILDKAQLRRLLDVSGEIRDLSVSSESIDTILDQSEQKLLSITQNRRTTEFRFGGNVAQQIWKDVQRLSSEKRKEVIGLATGYTLLDYKTRGFQKGDLILLAARPSVGKTAFALNLALESAIRNRAAVAIFSLEMPAEQLITRMLACQSMLNSRKLQTGQEMSVKDWGALEVAVNTLKQAQIYIDDSSMTKMSDIFAKCRKLAKDQQKNGNAPLGLVVIDYIQLINSSGHSENRQQEVSYISRQLKQLARELDVPVIALSQLSRSVEQRTDKRPMLSDLRESGSLEQDADMVMMLYRAEYHDSENRTARSEVEEIEVIIAKHRNGEIGMVPLQFMGACNKYMNTASPLDEAIAKLQ